jgi:hypothetical protein
LHALVVEAGDDAGPSTRRLRVRVPPRVLIPGDVLVDLAVRSDSGPEREKARK